MPSTRFTPEECIADYGAHCWEDPRSYSPGCDPCCTCSTPAKQGADTVYSPICTGPDYPGDKPNTHCMSNEIYRNHNCCDCGMMPPLNNASIEDENDGTVTYPSQDKENNVKTFTYTILFTKGNDSSLHVSTREGISLEDALNAFTADHESSQTTPRAIGTAPGGTLWRVDKIREPRYIISERSLKL